MWITPSRDKTLAELMAGDSIHGGGSIPSYLLQPRRNQWLDALNQVSPVILKAIQNKKSDDIANQYLRQVNSPFAGSGAAAVPYQEKYQTYLNDQPDTATDDEMFLKLWRENHPDETTDASGMTPYQREQTRLREMDIQRKLNKSTVPMYSRAIARGRLNAKGEFDNQYTGAESGEMAQVKTPDGKTLVVPWDAYVRSQNPALQAFQQAQDQSLPAPDLPAVGETPASLAPEVNTPTITTQEAYNALPSGTEYISPDGKKRRKP
jgi:C4-dicarboxylate-specific signal transduction histidine kinase